VIPHRRIATSLLMLAVAALVAAGAWRLISDRPSQSTPSKPAPAANVAKVVKEESLTTVTLTEEAESRLGVRTAPVVRKEHRRSRFYGGEAMIPVGRSSVVSAPLSGAVKAPADGLKQIGRSLKKGDTVLLLSPLLTPEARTTLAASTVDAEGQENNAKSQLEAATIALERARSLFQKEAGSRRSFDEAQATYDVVVKTLEAATARRAVLAKVAGEMQNGTAASFPIQAPDDGMLRNLSALPGQIVPAGGALFEIADLKTLWVRVPTPVGDLDELARDEPAKVGLLTAPPSAALRSANPIAAPPTANALSGTVDLYYELPNGDGSMVPGQRLGATLTLKGTREATTVPTGAVVYDIHGGSWVYELTAPRTYARRRVIVEYVNDGAAAVATSVAVGTPVVVEGALELFAAETGFVK
jgi:RND family efflux transporter MFP subunit